MTQLIEKPFKIPEGKRDTVDMFNAVVNDEWMFAVTWGPQRVGKSTCALWAAYALWRKLKPSLTEDELWERVFDCIVFNLGQLLYKLKDKSMPRVWDNKGLHYRIPIIIWDDFGVHSNKAITQYEQAWDEFKGAFDAFGTKLAVLILTMTTPDEPTFQIGQKYTHEIWIYKRGEYKYDKCNWQQNYRGWKARHSKDWQQALCFKEIPMHRYKRYDEMRMTLADEAIIRVEDAMAQKIPTILQRTTEKELDILSLIMTEGPASYDKIQTRIGEGYKNALKRVKAHQLVITERRKAHSWFDITKFGLDLYTQWQLQRNPE